MAVAYQNVAVAEFDGVNPAGNSPEVTHNLLAGDDRMLIMGQIGDSGSYRTMTSIKYDTGGVNVTPTEIYSNTGDDWIHIYGLLESQLPSTNGNKVFECVNTNGYAGWIYVFVIQFSGAQQSFPLNVSQYQVDAFLNPREVEYTFSTSPTGSMGVQIARVNTGLGENGMTQNAGTTNIWNEDSNTINDHNRTKGGYDFEAGTMTATSGRSNGFVEHWVGQILEAVDATARPVTTWFM